jgi:choline kinase
MGIYDVIVTTGPVEEKLINYARRLFPDVNFTFIHNEQYRDTNYIYSIYLAKAYVQDDIILIHGDLVFETKVLQEMLNIQKSCVVISSSIPLPEKDFKAVVDKTGKVKQIGVEFFESAYAAQPLYKLNKHEWICWLEEITKFCEAGERQCYAENALNQILDKLELLAFDVKEKLCGEIDNQDDLERMRNKIDEVRVVL